MKPERIHDQNTAKPELIHHKEWKRYRDDAEMDILVFRVPGGILHEMYANGDRCEYIFSPRPYVPGQLCDGTIDHCVFALFYDFCDIRDLDSADLYRRAYSDRLPESKEERVRTTRRAMAEGVAFPPVWNRQTFDGLLESLSEINNHSLASILEEAAGA